MLRKYCAKGIFCLIKADIHKFKMTILEKSFMLIKNAPLAMLCIVLIKGISGCK